MISSARRIISRLVVIHRRESRLRLGIGLFSLRKRPSLPKSAEKCVGLPIYAQIGPVVPKPKSKVPLGNVPHHDSAGQADNPSPFSTANTVGGGIDLMIVMGILRQQSFENTAKSVRFIDLPPLHAYHCTTS